LGKAPGISLSLRRAFEGGILAIVGVKFTAAMIGVGDKYWIANHKHGPNSYSGNSHDSTPHPYYISNMADAASGSADKSVQVKLVLLGALSQPLINPFWKLSSPYPRRSCGWQIICCTSFRTFKPVLQTALLTFRIS
jgi:hypothetical protein